MEDSLNYFYNEPDLESNQDFEKLTPQQQQRIREVMKKQMNYYAKLVGKGVINTSLQFTFVHWPKELTAENFSEDNVLILGLSIEDIINLLNEKIITKEKAVQMAQSTAIMAEKLIDYDLSDVAP